jgi:hypothetical protein
MVRVFNDWLPKEVYNYEKKKLQESSFGQVWVGDKDFHVIMPSEEMMGYVINKLENDLKENVEMILSFFRLASSEKDLDWRIHSDLNINGQRPTHAGVLYFSENKLSEGLYGTAFWSHKEYGSKLIPETTDEEYDRLLLVDANDVNKWSLDSVISVKENRLLLYEASLFHSKYPDISWGGDEDGRMVLVMFFNLKP